MAWLQEADRWRKANIPQIHVLKALLLVEETGAFYIPVPKAANTSIRAAIADGPSLAQGHGSQVPIAEPRNALQVGCRPADFRSGARVAFTAVRHPVERFWSAYNHLIVERASGPVGRKVRRALGLAPGHALTPELVLDYVEAESIEDIDHHFRPQYAICAVELLPVRIARCENLKEDLARLADDGLFPRASLARLGWANRRMSAVIHDRHRHIDARVAKVYGRDFEALGY